MQKSLTPSILAWLRAFDAVARHASFTRAADELSVSQGAVSQQVKSLEQALRVPLFRRSASCMALTPEGRRLAAVVGTAYNSVRIVLEELTKPSSLGTVPLSCSPSFAIRWLTPRLPRLPIHYSEANVELIGEFHVLTRARMQSEGLEVAIRYDNANYPDLDATPFLDEYLLPVASPAFLARHPNIASVADLDGRLLLHDTRPWDGAQEEEWQTYLNSTSLAIPNPSSGKRFNLSQLAITSALSDEGVAMGRLALVLDDLEAGRLVPIRGPVVRANAAYKFITAPDRKKRITAVEKWLEAESITFCTRRDAFLAACVSQHQRS